MSVSKPLSDIVVIFDLDGTLVDSAPDLAAAMNHVLALKGHPPAALESVRHLVGNGARTLLSKSFADYGLPDIPDEELAEYTEYFIDYYKTHIADYSRPFPCVLDTIDTLKELGAKIAICTNKREELAFDLLNALKITDLFDTIVCRDTLSVCKPEPEPLLACLSRTRSKHGILLGDTITDLDAALAADMPCLIASFGYGTFSEAEIKKARHFDHYHEVPSRIKEWAKTL